MNYLPVKQGVTRSMSLPQLSILNEDGLEVDLEQAEDGIEIDLDHGEVFIGVEDDISRVLSPLTPKLAPTFRAQTLSPFWLRGAQTSTPLHQIPGTTSISPLEISNNNNRTAAFSMLHAAAITGNSDGLSKLASGNFCDIDLRDRFGRTPLMYAVLGNYPECVDVLMKNGSDPTLVDSSGRTSLHWAVHHDHLDCIKTILNRTDRASVDWKTPDQTGVTILHLSARHRSKKCMQTIVKYYGISKNEVNLVDLNKRSSLHWSALHGSLECAKVLVKLGATTALLDVEGKSPIHWAVCSESEDSERLVNLLIQCKPNSVVNWQDHEGRQPLHLAAKTSSMKVVAALLNSNICKVNCLDASLRSPLHFAAAVGKTDVIKLLLNRGAKAEIQDESGATPVHLAVLSGSNEAVSEFVSRGLGDLEDMEGRSALMWAAASGSLSTLTSLARCDLDKADRQAFTALHISVSRGIINSVTTLVNYGASLEARTKEGFTPLMVASQLGQLDIVQTLIDVGADLHAVDNEGCNALHLVCQAGHAHLLPLLLKQGAKVNTPNRYGRTALIMASYGGFVEILSLLLNNEADINAQDNEGMCGLHWAVRRGQTDSVRLLLERGAYPNNIGTIQIGDSDEVSLTPLDSAVMAEQQDIISSLLAYRGITITRIFNIAATRIQAYWRGYTIRKSFNERKNLFKKHLELKAKKKKTGRSSKKGRKTSRSDAEESILGEDDINDKGNTSEEQDVSRNSATQHDNQRRNDTKRSRIRKVAGTFLGSVVEDQQNSNFRKRVEAEKITSHSTVQSNELNSVSLANLLDPEFRPEGKFSYNLNV